MTTPEAAEQGWLSECKSGDRAAFEPIVRRYGPRAYRFALAMVRDTEDAKDLSQEAFIRAYVALYRFDTARPFYPWFLKILRNLCLSHLRRRRWKLGLDDAAEPIEDRASKPEAKLMVEQALHALSASDREILMLKAEGLSYAELSNVLGIPRGTVMSRLYYARNRFGELVS